MREAARFQDEFGLALAGLARPPVPAALARALAIHRNTALRAARDALADNYPVVRALVGDEAFAGAATTFAEACPPADPRLCLYGAGFDDFLPAYDPFADLPWLGGVATLERLVTEALFAADAVALDGDAFAAIDLDQQLALHPAVRFARVDCPVASLWQAHQPGAVRDAIEAIEWRAETVLVTRPGDAVRVARIGDGALAFLDLCAAGCPLAEAAAAAGPDLPAIFAQLISAGAFA